MFSYYERLCDAGVSGDRLASEWGELTSRMVRPTSLDHTAAVERLDGHIPHSEAQPVWDAAPQLFARRGIYVWGAWIGDRARIQYIGIADHQTMRDRFAGLSGRTGRYRDELTNARKFSEQFRALSEAFSYSNALPLDRYRAKGIKVREYQPTRPPRSERYAKIGFNNLWYFLIPAPGEPLRRKNGESLPMDKVLCGLEKSLIQLASFNSFRQFRSGDPMAFPLLNRKEVLPNRFVPSDSPEYPEFVRWLDEGPWWKEMDVYVARTR